MVIGSYNAVLHTSNIYYAPAALTEYLHRIECFKVIYLNMDMNYQIEWWYTWKNNVYIIKEGSFQRQRHSKTDTFYMTRQEN